MTGGALLRMRFTRADLPMLRLRVATAAAAAGLDEARCDELVLAVYELACNAIQHGGGGGGLLVTRLDDAVCCQVSDDGAGLTDADAGAGAGADADPDAHRDAHAFAARRGGGLWLARQLADAVEIDAGAVGGTVATVIVRCRSNRRRPTD